MSARVEMKAILAEGKSAGIRLTKVCDVLGVSVRTLQRWIKNPDAEDARKNNRFAASNALSKAEQNAAIDVACSPEFRDKSPNQIVPILAEKGRYIGSESTLYRLLRSAGLLTHRSKAKAPVRERPEEMKATAPNQVWTWDISYLLTACRGKYFYLYLILDIWDRSIVGWSIEEEESGFLAGELLRKTCIRHGVNAGTLIVHQDNGAPMISFEFLAVLSHWGRASYSRPGVSDDNPFSESQFRTLKYRPDYPERFTTIDAATAWVKKYVDWYTNEHRHSGIGFVTPQQRRDGTDIAILATRRTTYEGARTAHPERWSRNLRRWDRPKIVFLNSRERKMDRQKEAA